MVGIRDLSLTTNGLLLADYAEDLYRAGLRRVNVSLDSLRPDRYARITRNGSLEGVLAGIKRAVEVGLNPVKINMVVIRDYNHDEIADFVALTREEGLHVRFIEFMPMGDGEFWSRDRYMSSEEVKAAVEAQVKLVPAEDMGGGPAVMYHLPGGKGLIGFISPISRHFCRSCDRLRITADGKMRTCLYSDHEIDLKTPLREGISDEELFNLLHHGTRTKPEGHTLDTSQGGTDRYMSQIGG
jgi:cyclic pyranopterin phosphate synthase